MFFFRQRSPTILLFYRNKKPILIDLFFEFLHTILPFIVSYLNLTNSFLFILKLSSFEITMNFEYSKLLYYSFKFKSKNFFFLLLLIWFSIWFNVSCVTWDISKVEKHSTARTIHMILFVYDRCWLNTVWDWAQMYFVSIHMCVHD